MSREGKKSERFKVIAITAIILAAIAFASGAFLALRTSKQSPASTATPTKPEVPVVSSPASTATPEIPVLPSTLIVPNQTKKLQTSPSAKPTTLPPPNTGDNESRDTTEDRD